LEGGEIHDGKIVYWEAGDICDTLTNEIGAEVLFEADRVERIDLGHRSAPRDSDIEITREGEKSDFLGLRVDTHDHDGIGECIARLTFTGDTEEEDIDMTLLIHLERMRTLWSEERGEVAYGLPGRCMAVIGDEYTLARAGDARAYPEAGEYDHKSETKECSSQPRSPERLLIRDF
jgi:hypothetical protein